MTWIKEILLFEDGGKFNLKAKNDWFTFVFATKQDRQWWINNYYKKIGIAKFTKTDEVESDII